MIIKLEKPVWVYIALLLAISFLVQLFVIQQGGEEYELFTVFIGIAMFLPSIGAIIYLLWTREGLGFIPWRIGKPLYLFLGLTIPSAITLLSVYFFELMGWGINTYYSFEEGEVIVLKDLFLLGNDKQGFLFFLANFFITGIAYSLLTGLVTLGEEIGWRGFLQKKLLNQNPLFISLLFLGFIWGIWHLPLILSGYNYPDYPVLGGFLLFPLVTISASFLLGWLTISSKSVWPAVFTHGGVNSIMNVLDSMDFGERKLQANFVIVGIWMLVGLFSYVLVKNKNVNKVE